MAPYEGGRRWEGAVTVFRQKKGATTFSEEKRGRRLFQRKKGGNEFSSTKKRGRGLFSRQKGGEDIFWHTKRGWTTLFFKGKQGAKTFPIISPNRQLNVFLEKDRNKWVFAVSMILGKKTLFLATFLLSSVWYIIIISQMGLILIWSFLVRREYKETYTN